MKFHLILPGEPETAASSAAEVSVSLSERAEAASLEWNPVDSRIYSVRFMQSK